MIYALYCLARGDIMRFNIALIYFLLLPPMIVMEMTESIENIRKEAKEKKKIDSEVIETMEEVVTVNESSNKENDE